ncbi:MAG TPA: hypothetical protein VM911_17000 [Pyrinomonadaceae bacterium]|nr:hypothetical protein [Pyrinomonadaceae bacterium]
MKPSCFSFIYFRTKSWSAEQALTVQMKARAGRLIAGACHSATED